MGETADGAIEKLLYQQSGLLGVSGVASDMRTLLASDSPRARLAIDLFVYRVGRELGSLAAALGGLDAIVFTGGIGENAPEIRARICDGLQWAGLELDDERNTQCVGGCEGLISTDASRLAAYSIPTDEELLIARDTVRCVRGAPQRY